MNSAVFLRLIKPCWPDSQAARRLKRLRQSRSLWMMEWYISLFPNRLKRLWHRRCEKLLLIARLLRHEESVQSGMHRFDKSSVGERHDASRAFPGLRKERNSENLWSRPSHAGKRCPPSSAYTWSLGRWLAGVRVTDRWERECYAIPLTQTACTSLLPWVLSNSCGIVNVSPNCCGTQETLQAFESYRWYILQNVLITTSHHRQTFSWFFFEVPLFSPAR